jgi:hypothetical protein
VQNGTHLVWWQVDVGFSVISEYKTMAVTMSLDNAFNFIQRGAGCTIIFDTLSLFPEMPRWRNW